MSESFDTNVLVYAASDSSADRERTAYQLMLRAMMEGWKIPAPVYTEFYNVMTRPLNNQSPLMTRQEAAESVEVAQELMPMMVPTARTYTAAIECAAHCQIQVFDALILVLCAEHEIDVFYTEDKGMAKVEVVKLLGVKCVNPFAALKR